MNSEELRAEEPEPGSMPRRSETTAPESPAETSSMTFPPPLTTLPAPEPISMGANVAVFPSRAKLQSQRRIEPINRAVVSDRSRAFLRQHFPGVSVHDWNDWKWQVRNRIRRARRAREDHRPHRRRARERDPAHRQPADRDHALLPLAALADRSDAAAAAHPHPGRRRVRPGARRGPRPAAARTTTPRCPASSTATPTACCSSPPASARPTAATAPARRMVGETNGEYSFSTSQWEKAAQYIEAHPEIRDCLLSGGDPLSIGDDKLEWLLNRLRSIKHLEFIRIGTKIPVVMPQRVTLKLTRMLKQFHPLWMSHPLHPPRRTDARDGRGLRPPCRCRHPARHRRPCCSRASTTTSPS